MWFRGSRVQIPPSRLSSKELREAGSILLEPASILSAVSRHFSKPRSGHLRVMNLDQLPHAWCQRAALLRAWGGSVDAARLWELAAAELPCGRVAIEDCELL